MTPNQAARFTDDRTSRQPRTSIASPEAGQRLRRRQLALGEQYRAEPERAWTTDHARTGAENQREQGALDPLHTWLEVGLGHNITLPVGVHRAVGGLGDLPVPGDILCAALAACADSTIRVVANALGVELLELEVDVEAHVDVRGTLCVSKEIPVAFQGMDVRVRIRATPETPNDRLVRLVRSAEHCCVVLRTLREGVPIQVECDTGAA
jgi:uncharacterized OsmC-like protein